MHVGTGISTQQGMISISETKKKEITWGKVGGGGGGRGVEAKQLLFLSSKPP